MTEVDPLLETGSKKAKAKKAPAKKAAPAKAKAAKAKAPAKAVKKGNGLGVMGRPASEETLERRKKILQAARAKNGVTNVDLAEKLGVTTAYSQSLCRSLINSDQLVMKKDSASGRVTYHTK